MKHIVISGTGRSGSNRMLDAFDQHEDTLCRNEVHALRTDFGSFPRASRGERLPEDFAQRWQNAVAKSAQRQSVRDRLKADKKNYFRLNARVLMPALRRRRVRQALLGRNRHEWLIPSIFLRPRATVVPVIKILSVSDWLTATHSAETEQIVIHIVRDPETYLNSWWNRFVSYNDREEIYQTVRNRSRTVIAANNGEPLSESFSVRDMLIGELWLWRSVHDELSKLSASSRYGLFRYEDYLSDPLGEAERAFSLSGLNIGHRHRERISKMQNVLFSKKHREALDLKMVRNAMELVLQESPLGRTYLT